MTTLETNSLPSSGFDYRKFDDIARDVDKQDDIEKEETRGENRRVYEKSRQKKIRKWEEQQRIEGKTPKQIEKRRRKLKNQSCGCASQRLERAARRIDESGELAKKFGEMGKGHDHEGHGHGHGHEGKGHSHGHSHSGKGHGHSHDKEEEESSSEEEPLIPMPTCGYADPAQLRRLAEQEKKEEIPLPVKNQKKLDAIEATRLDGGRLFKEGNYELALKVYDRGIMISNGLYGVPDKMWDGIRAKEATLDLNIAACKLKLKDYTGCIEHCKMALDIQKSAKGYYRMAEAYILLGEFDKAREQNQTAKELQPTFKQLDDQLARIKKGHGAQKAKAKADREKMRQRILEMQAKKNAKNRARTAREGAALAAHRKGKTDQDEINE